MLKNQEQIALFRYGVIASLLSVAESKGLLKEEITALSKKQWVHPDGSIVQLSFHVIEHWYYDFKRFRLQGLMPKKRKDTGQSRALDVAIQEEIARRKKAEPKLTTATIIRQLLDESKNYTPNVSSNY